MNHEVAQALAKWDQFDKEIAEALAATEAVVVVTNGTEEEFQAGMALRQKHWDRYQSLEDAKSRYTSSLSDELFDLVQAERKAR